MLWKRASVLIAISFLLAVVTEGQNQQSPNGPGSGSTEAKGKTYTIAGAVKRPGSYPLDRLTTIFEAINQAGGFYDGSALKGDIKIIRGERRLHFNYDDFLRGENKGQNIELEDGDVVQVGVKSRGPKLPPEP